MTTTLQRTLATLVLALSTSMSGMGCDKLMIPPPQTSKQVALAQPSKNLEKILPKTPSTMTYSNEIIVQ